MLWEFNETWTFYFCVGIVATLSTRRLQIACSESNIASHPILKITADGQDLESKI